MVEQLASTKDIRALFHHKPDISRAQIDALFAKHDFGLSRSITCLESNCTNQVFMIETHPKVKVHGGNVLLWGEAGLHNVLVENGSSLRISNVHDFQSKTPEYVGAAIADLESLHGYTG